MGHKPKTPRVISEQFARIMALNLEKCVLTVCLGSLSKDAEEPIIEQLQLTELLTNEFRKAANEMIRKYAKAAAKNELVFRPYDAGSKPDDHEVEFLDLDENESVHKQVESLASLADVPVFRMNDAFVSGLRFYAIVLKCKEGSIYFFRTYTPKKQLSKSRFFAAMFAEGTFDTIEEPVFLFDHRVDCLSQDGTMYIFSKHNFEKIFRFFELVLKSAAQTLKTIKAHVPIANFEEFQQACDGHLQMQAKLKNIAGKPYLKDLEIAHIKRVLKEFPDLGVEITTHNGKEMLLFNPQDKWAVLRLLDDDYLGSVLTGQKYEVTGKRPYKTA